MDSVPWEIWVESPVRMAVVRNQSLRASLIRNWVKNRRGKEFVRIYTSRSARLSVSYLSTYVCLFVDV